MTFTCPRCSKRIDLNRHVTWGFVYSTIRLHLDGCASEQTSACRRMCATHVANWLVTPTDGTPPGKLPCFGAVRV